MNGPDLHEQADHHAGGAGQRAAQAPRSQRTTRSTSTPATRASAGIFADRAHRAADLGARQQQMQADDQDGSQADQRELVRGDAQPQPKRIAICSSRLK